MCHMLVIRDGIEEPDHMRARLGIKAIYQNRIGGALVSRKL